MKPKRIIISGGGTGGHVFPAISIADAIKKLAPETDILFVGAENRLEMEKVPEAGYEIKGLPVAGLQRRLTMSNFSFPVKLIRSIWESKKIIKDFKPDIAVGVGGYASGPVLRTASRNNIPIVIQEQNSYAGLTNKLLSKKASRIFVAYEGMGKFFPEDKIILTGNPVRQDILEIEKKRKEALEFFNLDSTRINILIIGGSLGSGTMNNSIIGNVEEVPGNVQLMWQTGKYYYNDINERISSKNIKNVQYFPFIKRMDLAYAAADIIVSRAGAGTISELAIVGKPVILIPSPNVAEDHQTKNAMALVAGEAAIHIPDKEAVDELWDAMMVLADDKKTQKKLAENIKKLAKKDSAEQIAREILSMI